MNKKLFLSALLLCWIQYMTGQDAISSLNINIRNVQLSSDAKEFSYDVYLQKVNKDTMVAVPGFLFRLSVPQADIGLSAKKISLTNASEALGYCTDTIFSSGTDWLMKFLNGNLVVSYSDALVVSPDYPGTRIGTVHVENADGSSFPVPLTVNLNFSGTSAKNKTTCAVFKPNTTLLASNSTAPQPSSNFTGLGSYILSSPGGPSVLFNPTVPEFQISIGDKTRVMRLFDISGKMVMSYIVSGDANINLAFLPKGIYIIEIDGFRKKLVNK